MRQNSLDYRVLIWAYSIETRAHYREMATMATGEVWWYQ